VLNSGCPNVPRHRAVAWDNPVTALFVRGQGEPKTSERTEAPHMPNGQSLPIRGRRPSTPVSRSSLSHPDRAQIRLAAALTQGGQPQSETRSRSATWRTVWPSWNNSAARYRTGGFRSCATHRIPALPDSLTNASTTASKGHYAPLYRECPRV